MSQPTGRAPRIQIEDVWPQIDCGRYPVKRSTGDEVEVRATIFRDGHESLGAAILYRPPGSATWRETPLTAAGNDRWTGSFTADAPGRWEFTIQAWVDRFESFREEIRRKVEAGQTELDSELAEGALLLKVLELDIDAALASTETDRSEAAGLVRTLTVDVDRERARFGAWYELFPRSWGGFAGVERALPDLAKARLRRRLPAADPPDRPHEPQGEEQRAHRRARRARQPVGDRQRGRRAHGGQPGARHARGIRPSGRRRPHPRRRDRARLRDPVLTRPPVAEGAPGVVLPPPRRDAQVRREPAQALPGHLQRQLRQPGPGGAVGGAARRRALLGRARRAGVPRRQPAHEAAAVLGMADPGGARGRPGRRVPRRGLHATGDDGGAGEGGLQPVVHATSPGRTRKRS